MYNQWESNTCLTTLPLFEHKRPHSLLKTLEMLHDLTKRVYVTTIIISLQILLPQCLMFVNIFSFYLYFLKQCENGFVKLFYFVL